MYALNYSEQQHVRQHKYTHLYKYVYLCKWETKNSAATCFQPPTLRLICVQPRVLKGIRTIAANQNAQDWPRIWSKALNDYNWPNFSFGRIRGGVH